MGSYNGAFAYAQWTNYTTLSAGQFMYSMTYASPIWIRFADDGTYRTVQVSYDGYKYELVTAAQGRTVFLTADQVGVFAIVGKVPLHIPRVLNVLHWSQA